MNVLYRDKDRVYKSVYFSSFYFVTLHLIILTIFRHNLLVKSENIEKNKFTFINSNSNKTISFDYTFLNSKYYSQFDLTNDYTITPINSNTSNSNTRILSSSDDFFLVLRKNDLNYSINDAFYLDFGAYSEFKNPKHLQFFYFINETYGESNYEGCDIRFTNFTLDKLIANNYRTNYSDPVLFKIKTNTTITINDQSFYYNTSTFNQTGFNKIDIFLEWGDNILYIFCNNQIIDDSLTKTELATDFYHINLMENYTKPDKLLFYNLYPNTSCIIKNLIICEDYCDEQSQIIFDNFINSGLYLVLNKSVINIIIVFIFILF